jgi:hypothetical protein
MKKVFFADKLHGASPVAAPAKPSYAIAKLLASIDKNLPPPPAGTKYSVASIDELLARQNLSTARRMEIKYSLKMHGLLP